MILLKGEDDQDWEKLQMLSPWHIRGKVEKSNDVLNGFRNCNNINGTEDVSYSSVSNGADIICVSCSFHKRIEMRFQTNLAWTNMQIMQSRYDLRRSSIPPQKPSSLLSTLQSGTHIKQLNSWVPWVLWVPWVSWVLNYHGKIEQSRYYLRQSSIPPQKPSPLLSTLQSNTPVK